MSTWTAPQRPNNYAESSLISAILDGDFPPSSKLPGERTLAAALGVTRPTLREAIQRLARDGWLTVQHGKATTVNDIWRDGGLNILNTLIHYPDHLPTGFIASLLEVRLNLAPAYTRDAILKEHGAVVAFLEQHLTLADETAVYAKYDWQLHRHLTIQSGNPIYPLILNGFTDFYEQIACIYFSRPESRRRSRNFYAALLETAAAQDAARAEIICRKVMKESIDLWQSAKTAESE
ncbi:MAG: fatty acid metabolism transcriptional regulator FadR [Chloroflexi bacterium]|nr:MAG: fatty acid metabolism transcriptional regulator FadR [Chloroflexota bacterium]